MKINNKGCTLIELLEIIVLLGVIAIIVAPNVLKGGENAKKTLLSQKVETIETAAVTYGQDNKDKFTTECDSPGEPCEGISNCYCFDPKIKVENLIGDGLLSPDKDKTSIYNPLNDMDIKNCEIQIYTKYGRIYAIYDKKYADKAEFEKN